MKYRVWIKNEKSTDKQSEFGETISVLLTNPDNQDEIFLKAGPYTIPKNGMITHDFLVGNFELGHIHGD